MNNNILLFGRDGQLGGAFAALLGNRALAAGRDDIDFLDAQFIARLDDWLGNRKPAAVINAAAYTAVDKAEGAGRADAFRINAYAVGELAAWCAKRRLPLVHFSSDYVFDGSGRRDWQEGDPQHPVNAYGESKLEGERAIAAQKRSEEHTSELQSQFHLVC